MLIDNAEIFAVGPGTVRIEDGRIINLQTRTTPTHGRELTILQQLLGNLGKLTGEQLLAE